MGTQQHPPQPRVPDGRSPLWRSHNIFRVITLLYAFMWVLIQKDEYQRPVLAWIELGIMVFWTVFTIMRYRTRAGRTSRMVLIDQIVVTILLLCNEFILTDAQMYHSDPTVVTLWHPTMVTAAAVQWGMVGGGISGTVATLSSIAIRGYGDENIAMDTLLLIGAGLMVGLAADTARKSTERLSRALRAEAATAERERLARSIHDSVLQVLARVRRRGRELGGEAAELAELAGEQEIALRALVATAPTESNEDGELDLGGKLQVLATGKVQISVPATPVLLPAALATELFAVVREALENVSRHAGRTAKAWVLLEDLGSDVVVSVRDNGPGIPEGRLGEAADEGRMGIAHSIKGRVRSLGGTVSLETAPGEGTEWEVQVPRPSSAVIADRREGVSP